jgi:hypothetical protein
MSLILQKKWREVQKKVANLESPLYSGYCMEVIAGARGRLKDRPHGEEGIEDKVGVSADGVGDVSGHSDNAFRACFLQGVMVDFRPQGRGEAALARLDQQGNRASVMAAEERGYAGGFRILMQQIQLWHFSRVLEVLGIITQQDEPVVNSVGRLLARHPRPPAIEQCLRVPGRRMKEV